MNYMCDNKGSIANVLMNNREEIFGWYGNPSVGLMQFKLSIIALIKSNYNDTEGCRKVVLKIQKCKSKDDLLQYVCNTMVYDKTQAAI